MSVELEVTDAVATLSLNRPDKLNALNLEMREQLVAQLTRVRFDPSIRALVITGKGRGFCSGADVGGGGQPDFLDNHLHLQRFAHTYMTTLLAMEKPVIAAVRGPAVGVGWSIVLGCDLVVASTSARFSLIFRKTGLAPDGGAAWFLTRHIGLARTKQLAFSARFVEAAEALQLGLVNEVVEEESLMPRALNLAREMAEGPTLALGLTKTLCHAAIGPSLEEFLQLEALIQPQLRVSHDNAEGVAAFKEKRPPKFVGR